MLWKNWPNGASSSFSKPKKPDTFPTSQPNHHPAIADTPNTATLAAARPDLLPNALTEAAGRRSGPGDEAAFADAILSDFTVVQRCKVRDPPRIR
jgi:hypothetical protein